MDKLIQLIKRNKIFQAKYFLFPLLIALVAYQFFLDSAQFKKGEQQTEYLRNIKEQEIDKIELCESEISQVQNQHKNGIMVTMSYCGCKPNIGGAGLIITIVLRRVR